MNTSDQSTEQLITQQTAKLPEAPPLYLMRTKPSGKHLALASLKFLVTYLPQSNHLKGPQRQRTIMPDILTFGIIVASSWWAHAPFSC